MANHPSLIQPPRQEPALPDRAGARAYSPRTPDSRALRLRCVATGRGRRTRSGHSALSVGRTDIDGGRTLRVVVGQSYNRSTTGSQPCQAKVGRRAGSRWGYRCLSRPATPVSKEMRHASFNHRVLGSRGVARRRPRRFDGRSGDDPADGGARQRVIHSSACGSTRSMDFQSSSPCSPPSMPPGLGTTSVPTEPPASGHGRQPDRTRST